MIKLYYADISLLGDQQVFEDIFEKVNIQRRTKILRCKNEQDKKRSLLAGYLLKLALEESGYAYEKLEFSQTKEGKPILPAMPDYSFSISHGGRFAVCAFADELVGVDIESGSRLLFQCEKEEQLERVAEKCLSQAEKWKFSRSRKSEKKEVFLKYWTRKESFSKALGKGLGLEFSSINTEQMEMKYWSEWIEDEYYISIYKEDGDFSTLEVKKIISL